LFVFNADCVYDRDSVIVSARITPETASKELAALARAGVISRKTFYKEVVRPGSREVKKRKTIGWQFNQKYPYLEALSRFLRDTLVLSHTDIKKRLRGAGTIKFLALAGFLIGEKDNGIDMLIVGNKLSDKGLQNAMSILEAECGQEIRYAVLSVDDYRFRRRVRDKLVRDVLDYPHVTIVDKVGSHK